MLVSYLKDIIDKGEKSLAKLSATLAINNCCRI